LQIYKNIILKDRFDNQEVLDKVHTVWLEKYIGKYIKIAFFLPAFPDK